MGIGGDQYALDSGDAHARHAGFAVIMIAIVVEVVENPADDFATIKNVLFLDRDNGFGIGQLLARGIEEQLGTIDKAARRQAG